jgi:hypothetical protein
MPNASPSAIAERTQTIRNKMLWLAPMLFFIGQGALFSSFARPHTPLRTVEIVSLGSHVLLALVLLMLLATGGGWKHGKVVRALLDDEATRAHRAQAYAAGFWAVALCALGLYVAAPFVSFATGDIANVLLTVVVVVPALRFVMLERRAARD